METEAGLEILNIECRISNVEVNTEIKNEECGMRNEKVKNPEPTIVNCRKANRTHKGVTQQAAIVVQRRSKKIPNH